ncbi:MAG: APC family permease, partial [Planctomycetota bacterium]
MENVKLKKNMGLLDVFSVGAGAMISSGLFVLPAIAFRKAGPSMLAAYMLASALILPSVFTKAELATAMPRAGGTYFYVERSLGGLWGLFCGLANWFSLALKSAFAIFGMALFIKVFFQWLFNWDLSPAVMKAIAVACCVVFGTLNIVSVKHTTRFQNLLVLFLLGVLGIFVVLGISHVQPSRFNDFVPYGKLQILTTAGAVFISFGGLTKVASIAEEVRHPGRLLPQGMLLSWAIVSFLYCAVVFITIGVMEPATLGAADAPVSSAAGVFLKTPGAVLLSLAALAAFITTANGGILAASRCPMAMSRDHLLPPFLAQVNKRFQTPVNSVLITCLFMIASIVFLDLVLLVKTASTLMLLLFLLDNASVIIMRQSNIQTYRPRFKSPFYPWLQIVTIIVYIILLVGMGAVPLLITGGFLVLSVVWYFVYAAKRASRDSAVMHVVQRVTDKEITSPTLENELRDILFERDNIIADRFDHLL